MSGIEYTLKRSRRARALSVSVRHTGDVVVTLPWFMPAALADRFVSKKAEWILDAQERMHKRFANKVALKQSRTEYKKLKEVARKFIEERLDHFNREYCFSWSKIRITMSRSRWGSCSAKGSLSFSYSLIKVPPHLLDYVVVHELCHLKEMNHGPRFWTLVAKAMPDYLARRKELKRWVHID